MAEKVSDVLEELRPWLQHVVDRIPDGSVVHGVMTAGERHDFTPAHARRLLAALDAGDDPVVADLRRQLGVLVDYIGHDRSCTAQETGVPDFNCDVCTNADLQPILFPGWAESGRVRVNIDAELAKIKELDAGDGTRGMLRRRAMAHVLGVLHRSRTPLQRHQVSERLTLVGEPLSESSVKRYLEALVKHGLVTRVGEQRHTVYTADG